MVQADEGKMTKGVIGVHFVSFYKHTVSSFLPQGGDARLWASAEWV